MLVRSKPLPAIAKKDLDDHRESITTYSQKISSKIAAFRSTHTNPSNPGTHTLNPFTIYQEADWANEKDPQKQQQERVGSYILEGTAQANISSLTTLLTIYGFWRYNIFSEVKERKTTQTEEF